MSKIEDLIARLSEAYCGEYNESEVQWDDLQEVIHYLKQLAETQKSDGDLISREALKNEVDTWGCNDFDKYDFIEAIDNAPTVSDRYDEGYAQGYIDGSTGADWRGEEK